MKVVLDTNVFVSGVFFGGTPGRVLEAWRDGKAEVVLSREIVEEYVRVGEPPLSEPVSRDVDDDKFLACALAAGADYVVSGDRDLLDVSSHKGVVVLSPRDFVDRLQ